MKRPGKYPLMTRFPSASCSCGNPPSAESPFAMSPKLLRINSLSLVGLLGRTWRVRIKNQNEISRCLVSGAGGRIGHCTVSTLCLAWRYLGTRRFAFRCGRVLLSQQMPLHACFHCKLLLCNIHCWWLEPMESALCCWLRMGA